MTAAIIVPVHQEDNHDEADMDDEDQPETHAKKEKQRQWTKAKKTITDGYEKANHKIENFVGKIIRKSFVETAYEGRVAYHHEPYYRVNYDDGDIDDMSESEIRFHMHSTWYIRKSLLKYPQQTGARIFRQKHCQS